MAVIVPPVDITETDVSSLFQPYTERRICIGLGPRLYEIRLAAEAERVRRVFQGFARLAGDLAASGRKPSSFAMIGAGSGVEAIGAAHIFTTLRHITITDRDPAILAQAAANLAGNVPPRIGLQAVGGHIHAPLAAASGRRVDILYANFANVPFSDSPEAVIDRRSYCPRIAGTAHDDLLNRCQLAAPWRLLSAARTVLNPGGFALVLLGGRFDFSVFERLADAAHVRFEEIICGLKRQIDGDNVLSGYAAAETPGQTFDFYDFDRARRGLRGQDPRPGPVLAAVLAPWRLSACEALRSFRAGASIGHTYHLLQATPQANWGEL